MQIFKKVNRAHSFLFRITLAFVLSSMPLALAEEARTPPEFLYHMGERGVLMEDIQANTVPAEAWKKFIMGDFTRFHTPSYRRGLYGAEAPALALKYGDALIGHGPVPWMMIIAIKDECRKPRSIGPAFLYSDTPGFMDWIKKNATRFGFPSSGALIRKCMIPDDNNRLLYDPGQGYDVSHDSGCSMALSGYFDDSGYKIIPDIYERGSWYIRDRSCIAAITGTANDLKKVLLRPGVWSANLVDHGYDSLSALSTLVMQNATDFSIDDAERLISDVEQGKEKLRKSGDYNDWYKQVHEKVLGVTRNFIACAKKSRLAIFRADLTAYHKKVFAKRWTEPDQYGFGFKKDGLLKTLEHDCR